jgi:hypothetical protein
MLNAPIGRIQVLFEVVMSSTRAHFSVSIGPTNYIGTHQRNHAGDFYHGASVSASVGANSPKAPGLYEYLLGKDMK